MEIPESLRQHGRARCFLEEPWLMFRYRRRHFADVYFHRYRPIESSQHMQFPKARGELCKVSSYKLFRTNRQERTENLCLFVLIPLDFPYKVRHLKATVEKL